MHMFQSHQHTSDTVQGIQCLSPCISGVMGENTTVQPLLAAVIFTTSGPVSTYYIFIFFITLSIYNTTNYQVLTIKYGGAVDRGMWVGGCG